MVICRGLGSPADPTAYPITSPILKPVANRTIHALAQYQVGDDGQVRWECSANLPSDASLGPVEVSCEGYDSPSDPYVLVGSCSLSYSLDAVGPG